MFVETKRWRKARPWTDGRVMFVAAVLLAGVVPASDVQAQAGAQSVAPVAADDARFGQPGEQSQPGASELRAGRDAAVNGRWQEALDHFRTVLADYPDGALAPDAAYWAAKSLEQLGRYVDAVERVNEFIVAYPQSQLVHEARVVRLAAAEALVSQGYADYERYLRQEAETSPQPPRPPAAGQAPEAPQAADVDTELRIMALDALIGMDAEAAWPILQRIVSESEEAEVRQRAVWLLSQVDTDEAFDLLVEMARSDADPEIRSNAMFWVGQSAGRSDQAMDLLIEIVNSGGSEESVGQALFGLGQSSDPRAQQALEALARDTSRDAELRGQALFWLGEQGSSLDLLRDVVMNDPDEELRGQALFGIAQADSEEASEFLLEVARSDLPLDVRSSAIFWLGERGDDRALDILIGLWDEVDEVEFRNQLLFALSQSETEGAIDKLIEVATDDTEDPDLRKQAVFWLGQSEHPKAKAAILQIIGDADADR